VQFSCVCLDVEQHYSLFLAQP